MVNIMYNKKSKRNLKKIEKFRFNCLETFVIILFSILIFSIFKITIIDNEKYVDKLNDLTENIIYGSSSPRGRIYDRNYNLLVDNKAVPVIYYKKPKGVTTKEEIEAAYNILKYIEVDNSNLTSTNFKEFWIADNPKLAKDKITNEEWIKYKNRKLTSMDIY